LVAGAVEKGIFPDVVQAKGRVGEHKAAVFAFTHPRADHILAGGRGIEGHVGFLFVFAQPGKFPGILFGFVGRDIVIIENYDHGPDFASHLHAFGNIQFARVPVADGFADINAVEHGGGEGLSAPVFFGQDLQGFFS
jgi:hypothetical protein